jgi:hypothetical protein
MAQIFRNRIGIEQELILETNSDEAISSDSERQFDEHTMAVEIGQNHNIHGIVVVSVLLLEVSVD